MKINEFKTNKKSNLNELDLSSFIGSRGAAAVKSGVSSLMGRPGTSTAAYMAQDKFMKDFMSNLSLALDSAVKGKTVSLSPTATPGQPASPATPAAPAAGQPAAPTAPAAPSAARPGQPAARPAARPTAQTTPTKATTPGAGAFGQMASQLSSTKSSTGGTTTQTPTGVKHTANPKNPNLKVKEAISLIEQQSVSDFVQAYTNKYLKGTKGLSNLAPQIKKHADAIQAAYAKGPSKITDPLKNLANLVYSATATAEPDDTTAQPASAGAPPSAGQTPTGSASTTSPATATSTASPTVYKQVQDLLPKLDKKGKQRILAILQRSLGTP